MLSRGSDGKYEWLIRGDMAELFEKEASTEIKVSSYIKRAPNEPNFDVSTACFSGPS